MTTLWTLILHGSYRLSSSHTFFSSIKGKHRGSFGKFFLTKKKALPHQSSLFVFKISTNLSIGGSYIEESLVIGLFFYGLRASSYPQIFAYHRAPPRIHVDLSYFFAQSLVAAIGFLMLKGKRDGFCFCW